MALSGFAVSDSAAPSNTKDLMCGRAVAMQKVTVGQDRPDAFISGTSSRLRPHVLPRRITGRPPSGMATQYVGCEHEVCSPAMNTAADRPIPARGR
jgi:hypothetical protein